MAYWNSYHLAKTLDDAVQALANAPGPARVIGGGTDLLLDLQQGRHAPVDTLVDVTRIPELTVLETRGDYLYVGAAVPLSRIVASPLAGQWAQALVDSCNLIAGPQVRNTATLGGNVAHALPAADGTISLMALGAEAEIVSDQGCRRAPMTGLFLGPGKTGLVPGKEILAGFYLPLAAPEGSKTASAFRRVMRPQGVALPILNMAVWVARRGSTLEALRIAVGPGGPVPFRALAAEALMCGRGLDPAAQAECLEALLSEARFRTSARRATADYRRRLAAGLLEETLTAAWERAA